jgi:hypothetical protein
VNRTEANSPHEGHRAMAVSFLLLLTGNDPLGLAGREEAHCQRSETHAPPMSFLRVALAQQRQPAN